MRKLDNIILWVLYLALLGAVVFGLGAWLSDVLRSILMTWNMM